MISCSDAVRRLWEYLGEDLDTANQARVEEHLALCRRCCGEAEFTVALRDMLRDTSGPNLPPDVEQHFLGLLCTLERDMP